MATLRDRLQDVQWPRAAAGIVLSCIAGLSVHIVMLQVAHVPYPAGYPTTGWPIFCGVSLSAFALLWFCHLTADRLAALSVAHPLGNEASTASLICYTIPSTQ